MREVGTTVSRQRVFVDGRDGACVDICTLNQVVDEKEEQHSEREVRNTRYRDAFYQNLKSVPKRLSGAETADVAERYR